MHTEQFIRERMYLKGVSPKTVAWYRHSFKAFNGALNSRDAVIDSPHIRFMRSQRCRTEDT
jgi:hypothetical protein